LTSFFNAHFEESARQQDIAEEQEKKELED